MLYREISPEDFVPWTGELIGDGEEAIRYPANIEQIWTAKELAAIGLYAPVVDTAPEGQLVASSEVRRVKGLVKRVDTYADAPAPEATIEDRLAYLEKGLGAVVAKGVISKQNIDAAVAVEADVKAEAVKG